MAEWNPKIRALSLGHVSFFGRIGAPAFQVFDQSQSSIALVLMVEPTKSKMLHRAPKNLTCPLEPT